MNESYDRGIAFIFEGATEKVFYRSLLKWIARKNGCTFEKIVSEKDADLYYIWTHRSSKILIKVNTVGAITQITNTGKWFINTCAKKHKVPWRVYLCYDTDNAQNDITKFYEGDWKLLRTDLKKTNAEVIDLAASADIEAIRQAYMRMYDGMISKDEKVLNDVLDDSFVLVHMTGMRQPKQAFIKAVLNGTLNYFSAEHENMPVEISGDTAVLTGQSYVAAAVFGGGRHNWHLQQKCSLKKTDGVWKITRSVASTY